MTDEVTTLRAALDELRGDCDRLREDYDEVIRQFGDQLAPFPAAGIDGFLSHFIITLRLTQGPFAGAVFTFTLPPSSQTVSRSDPFRYEGRDRHTVSIPLPSGCTLPDTVSDSDFVERPEEYFEVGGESVWMQILNLDARGEVEGIGAIRILIGQTLLNEYPDIFRPSHGVAQSLRRRGGFPARLFFNPFAIIETPLGAFRAVHGTLAYGRVTEFPPIGTDVTIREMEPLLPVDAVRAAIAGGRDEATVEPAGQLLALAHPIDASLRVPPDEAFNLVGEPAAAPLVAR
jgi:hypothetical protein